MARRRKQLGTASSTGTGKMSFRITRTKIQHITRGHVIFGLLIFMGAAYIGYNGSLLYFSNKNTYNGGVEVQISFGNNPIDAGYSQDHPLYNVAWNHVTTLDVIDTSKATRTFVTSSSGDYQSDLAFFNQALRRLRKTYQDDADNQHRSWARHFHVLDVAVARHVTYFRTLSMHANVASLLMQKQIDTTSDGQLRVGRSLGFPTMNYYQWTSSPRLCEDLPQNHDRFANLEEVCHRQTDVRQSELSLQSLDPELILANPLLPNYPLYVHVITDGLIDSLGNVFTGSLMLVPLGCDPGIPFKPFSNWKIYAEDSVEDEVFCISHYYSRNPNGFIVDSLSRMAPYMDFLLSNRHVKIHIYTNDKSERHKMLAHLKAIGINQGRLVSGHIRSKLVYLPQGGGCSKPYAFSMQLLRSIYPGTSHSFLSKALPKRVLFIDTDWPFPLVHRTEIHTHLERLTKHHGLQLRVLDSNYESKNVTDIIRTFAHSAIVLGATGPVLSGYIVFCSPGTVVIEQLCAPPDISLSTLHVAYSLGLRYHGLPARAGCAGGIESDLEHVVHVLQYFITIISDGKMGS